METKRKHYVNAEKNTVYECPMRCEEGKVYIHPVNCPVCDMKLVPVDTKKTIDYHIQYY